MASHYDGADMARRELKRTTTPMFLRVPHEVRERAAQRAKAVGEDISEYVARLIREDTPRQSAVAATLPALLGHRCVAALEACEIQVRNGANYAAIIGELLDIRWDIVAALESLRPAYERDLDVSPDPPYDGKHA